ncbi:ABC transporter substrate-binding protein [Rugamonas sp.]|uniref:substrate-binding periplasmic protein n=1 Tax=Rugamonas sp. TaxID=1926287 RepID=UPI0025D96174|nr:transporter substrate-binding domain-containing protein [Rugamonas sp.]
MDIDRQRRTWTRGFLAGALGLLLPQHAAARPPLKLAVMSVLPLGMVDATGKPFGMYADMGVQVVRDAGFEAEVAVVPLPRAIALLAAGQSDLLIAFQTKPIADAAIPLYYVANVDVIIAGLRGSSFNNLSDLHGKTVGQQRGADYDPRFSGDSAIKKYDVTDTPHLLRMLMAGRVDAVIANANTLLYYLKSAGMSRDQLGSFMLVRRRQSWLWYSRKTYEEATALKLKAALRRMHANGELDAIYQHYVQGL